jgi:hypothetical protein
MPVHASHGNYAMTDSNGTMNLRYNRPYHNVNWGYQISAPVRSIIVGGVTETGLMWWPDNAYYKGAPHVSDASYLYHGTMSHVYDYSQVTYYDLYKFTVNIAGRVSGRAQLPFQVRSRPTTRY